MRNLTWVFVAEMVRTQAADLEKFGARIDALAPPAGFQDLQRAYHNLYFLQAAAVRAWADAIESGDPKARREKYEASAAVSVQGMDEVIAAVRHHGGDVTQLTKQRDDMKAYLVGH